MARSPSHQELTYACAVIWLVHGTQCVQLLVMCAIMWPLPFYECESGAAYVRMCCVRLRSACKLQSIRQGLNSSFAVHTHIFHIGVVFAVVDYELTEEL